MVQRTNLRILNANQPPTIHNSMASRPHSQLVMSDEQSSSDKLQPSYRFHETLENDASAIRGSRVGVQRRLTPDRHMQLLEERSDLQDEEEKQE